WLHARVPGAPVRGAAGGAPVARRVGRTPGRRGGRGAGHRGGGVTSTVPTDSPPPGSRRRAPAASEPRAAEQVRVPKVGELVASDLRRKILSGTLEVGHSLREAELMEEYEISRPTLREALR